MWWPDTVSHKYDKHQLTLRYFPIENYNGDYFCEVCEEEFNPNAMERKEKEGSDEEDVFENKDQATQSFMADEILGNDCGVERRELWNELSMHKSIVNNKAWVIMGDFNVTLKPEEHYNGASSMSTDMNEFKNPVNKIEVEDLRCTSFQFTWTKSLKNTMCNTLKKLDRIMINDSFIQMFEEANGVFIPYLISNHSPAIMSIPRGITKKKKSFRFANYVADKDEFLELVNEELKHKVSGSQMYKVVQRLKLLKKPLNKLNWQNGNLFERANTLKEKLK
nr:RNA-directed DNA polymerase, eukaryota, reverse transcriptase zinc-binding domain protein [Tanacetum cinerariifolium]